MGAEVTKRVQGTPLAKKLEVILGDVIKMPQIPPCDALISNTPYQISSPLIFKMLSMPNPPRVAVLMVRRPPRRGTTYPRIVGQLTSRLVPTRVCKETCCEARYATEPTPLLAAWLAGADQAQGTRYTRA